MRTAHSGKHRYLALLMALLIGLVAPATTQADPANTVPTPRTKPPETARAGARAIDYPLLDEDEDAHRVPLFVVQALRYVQVMVTTMGVASSYLQTKPNPPKRYPPPPTQVPLVVKSPVKPQHVGGVPIDNP